MVESKSPVNTGVFLANSLVFPFFIKKSEVKPESKTPQNAARNGSDVKNPDLIKSKPR